MKIDFHVHTKYSIDSLSSINSVVSACKKKNIAPAIADHNNMDAHSHLKSMKFDFIPAEEISTDKGDLIGLCLTSPIKKKTPFLEALDQIKEQGAISYLPHMYDVSRGGVADERLAKKVDIIETFNPRCILPGTNERAESFAITNKKLKAAGSDAHFASEIGNAYVELPEFDLDDPKALLNALKKGRIIGKKAHFFMRGTGPIIKTAKTLKKQLFG
jgi:predicted metal-dependent phosphoesterase TrpH